MLKAVFLINAILTLPFGVVAMVAPGAAFDGFGIALDPAAHPVVRGYAAACLGFGLVMLLMRDARDDGTAFALLVGSLVFNGLEVAIQLPLGLSGGAGPAIWGTITGHGIAALMSLAALVRRPA